MKIKIARIFLVGILVSACGVGSGPYDSEIAVVSALNKYIKKACECGEARYREYNLGEEVSYSGCRSNEVDSLRVLARYEQTPEAFKSSRTNDLHNQLQGCLDMD